ncbi:MAG: hypothetical protein AB8F94_09740 [Saprospiraceae bacterium]
MKLSKMNFSVNVMLAVVFFFFANDVIAQDKIYKKNQKTPIEAQVIEIGTSEIKYKLYENRADDLIYVLEKNAIEKIEFEEGNVETFGVNQIDMVEHYQGQKRRALKVGLISPLIGTTKISYEQTIRPGRSFEVKGTFIGIGFNGSSSSGMYGSVGYKMYKKPNFITSDMKRSHLMQGLYVKPEVFFGSYTGGTWDRDDQKLGGAGALLNVGMQWVLAEVFVFDVAIGGGYGTGESYQGYLIHDNFVTAGSINIGFLF